MKLSKKNAVRQSAIRKALASGKGLGGLLFGKKKQQDADDGSGDEDVVPAQPKSRLVSHRRRPMARR